MNTLAIIGAGQLGSRHLQALCNLKGPFQIFAVDPSTTALETARSRLPKEGTEHLSIHFITNLAELPSRINVAIVATNSGPRRKVVELLIQNRTIDYLILEKVLFPNVADYQWASEALNLETTYVNCPTRLMNWATDLKAKVSNRKTLNMHVSGSALGLACNSIHYLDLFQFLTGISKYSFHRDLLIPEAIPAKRHGYYEINGTACFNFGDGFGLTLQSFREGALPTMFEVVTETSRHKIEFAQSNAGVVRSSDLETGWSWRESPFTQKFQSELSQTYVESLMASGSCSLTPLATSIQLHMPMVLGLRDFFAAQGIAGEFDCPIS